jgi:site-specific recombinase XerD
METNIVQLISLCKIEMDNRDYGIDYTTRITSAWDSLVEWMSNHKISDFTESVGNDFCDAKIGTHLSRKVLKKSQRVYLRATRMLISYQRNGAIENCSPRVEHIYSGVQGKWIQQYLVYLQDIRRLRPATILSAEKYLYLFYVFMRDNFYDIENINFNLIERFHRAQSYPISSRHYSNSAIRQYLRHLNEQGRASKDYSVYLARDNYRRTSDIPTTYTEDEIRRTLAVVDRASSIGKRNYLVLVLAAEYGWRNSDIAGFTLDQIDWDKNIICLIQSKTGIPVEFPLLTSVGNAIIDYLKNARPNTDADEVILSVKPSRKAKPLSGQAISNIVAQYLEKANIRDWHSKKHGTHSFRHSLASTMLNNDVPLPIISSVLGHSSSESTKIYLKVDTEKLRLCTLPMPTVHSPYYRKGGIWA